MHKINVPYINQCPLYPTGCESVSTVMLLHYLGIDITVDDFIGRYLDMHPMSSADGCLTGPDPNVSFAGSPYDPDSFGCYAPVIIKAASKIPELSGYNIADLTGSSAASLTEQFTDRGIPVIIWSCIDMKEPVTGPSWKISGSDRIFTWTSNEHCMLLTGYDDGCYYFNDPWNGNGFTGYDRSVFESRYAAQGKQAVAIYL